MLFNTLLVIILSVSGVLSQEGWGVTYTAQRICALKESSVDMSCTYSYPTPDTVRKTFWVIPQNSLQDLSQAPEYSQRVEYLGKQNSDCAFRINQLRITDSGTYGFRFLTASNNLTGKPGVTLKVTDLQVMVNPDTETVGQSVRLTCSTTCTLTGSPAFIWYRDGSPLSFTDQSHQFTASSEDASKYSCAVKGYELQSPAVALNVRYPPKSTSVSVSPSGEIVEGSSVTLTCSSDAKPPVQKYTWLKKTGSVFSRRGSEQSYTINRIKSWDAGEYYCEAVNVIGTGRSPPIRLDVQYRPKSVSVTVRPSGEIVEGSSVTLTCSSYANPPVQRYTLYKNNRAVSSETGGPEDSYTIKSISLQDAGEYYCVAQNRIGIERSPAKHLDVQCLQVMVNPDTVTEGQSVRLTCRTTCTLTGSSAFIWYRDGSPLSFTDQSHQFTAISEDAGRYSCAVKGYELHSPAVALNVRYRPKSTSVAVSPSGEIVEGSSVTLTCSSDANPPVQIYTWFKQNETGVWQAGSGQSLNFSNFRSWNSGQYYCEAQNRLGAQNASAILVTVQGGHSLIAAAAVGVAEILALVFLGVCLRIIRRRKSTNETEGDRQGNKSPIDGNFSEMAMSHTGTQDMDRDNGHQPHQ